MPMHDWNVVEPTIYHHFHQRWSVAIVDALNAGILPPGLPAWIDMDCYVSVPLERTYQAAWDVCPADYRHLVEFGQLPDDDAFDNQI